MRKALLENGVVKEILDVDPWPDFHPDMLWVDADAVVEEGWRFDGIAFTPPPPPLLAKQVTDALAQIDSAAGVARAKYMTIVAGQEATYQQKAASCRKWIADGKPTTISAAIYPGLNADYEARRRHDAATSLQTTVDEVLATEALWIAKLDAIELARRAGKIAISAAADSTAVDAARDASLSELAGL